MKIVVNEQISVDIKLKVEGQMSLEELDSLVRITRPMMKANQEVINLEDIDGGRSVVVTEQEVARNHHKKYQPRGKNGTWAKWTNAKKEKFKADVIGGMKYNELVDKYKITQASVWNFKKKLGLPLNQNSPHAVHQKRHPELEVRSKSVKSYLPKDGKTITHTWTPELAQQFWNDSKWMTFQEMQDKYKMTYHMVSKTKGKIKRGLLNQECKDKVRL